MKTHFINGQWIEGRGEAFTSSDPFTNEEFWHGHEAIPNEVKDAVNTARQALPAWSENSINNRIAILNTFADNLKAHRDELAELISKESGKPYWESLTEVAAMTGKITLSIQAFNERTTDISREMPGKKSTTRFKPHGVVAVFGPFNFPGHLANGHIVPALLAGNTVIFKPSELTPAVAQKMVELWQQSNIPNGVINLIQGGRATGEALIQNANLNGVFFTGSAQTGKIINKALAERPQTILALEMEGNNPLVVTDVADIKTASYLTIQSAFITAGQRCTCARRLIVPNSKLGDDFLNQFISDIQNIKIGHYTERPEPFIGPVITMESAKDILHEQDLLYQAGGVHLYKMSFVKEGTALIQPGVMDVTNVKNREDKEIFGPLLQVIRVKNFQEALDEANNTAYGLAAGIITDEKPLYKKFYQNCRAGIVNWNNQLTGASSAAPFGGIGLSGNHRPSAYFAADYCSYPVASLESDELKMPEKTPPGLG